jgi:hypothetical protein
MIDLPVAAFLATRLVERQFTYGELVEPVRPVVARPVVAGPVARPFVSVQQPVRRTRVAVAGALERAARVVAPDGHRLAH